MAFLAQLIDDVVVSRFEINKAETTVGRHPGSDIQIDDLSVSGRHAAIVREANKYLEGQVDYYIEDRGSTNGTYVNNVRIDGRQLLNNNDMIRLAWNNFKFVDSAEGTLEVTAHNLSS